MEKHAKKLVEVLEHTALCVLNREMHDIKPYMYLNPNTPQKYHIGYQCFSLYDEIILEIASMYMRNTLLTKCARHDCDVLFIPSKHHDKKYCSINCKDIVARRRYDEKKHTKKAISQPKMQKTDNN